MTEWKNCQLGDVLTLQRGFDLPMQNRIAGSIPLIASTGAVGYHNESKVSGPGVVIDRMASISGRYYIKDDFWPLKSTLWVDDFHENHARYCYYLLKSIDFSNYNIDKKRLGLNWNHLRNHPVRLPPPHEQKSIASALGVLDDIIENNQRLNETLEDMARAIFKSWFVDFDPVHAKAAGNQPAHMDAKTAALFPSSFGEDGLPEGWGLTKIEDVASQTAMGTFCSTGEDNTFFEDGIPIVSHKHLSDTLLEEGRFSFIADDYADRHKHVNIYRDDIVFTREGNTCQVSIIPDNSKYERYVLSERHFYLRCDKSKISPKYVVYYFKSRMGQQKLFANISPHDRPLITRPVSHLKSIEICLPTAQVLSNFEEIINVFHLEFSYTRNLNKNYIKLFNTLLPKVMSGEVRFNNDQAKEAR